MGATIASGGALAKLRAGRPSAAWVQYGVPSSRTQRRRPGAEGSGTSARSSAGYATWKVQVSALCTFCELWPMPRLGRLRASRPELRLLLAVEAAEEAVVGKEAHAPRSHPGRRRG